MKLLFVKISKTGKFMPELEKYKFLHQKVIEA